MLSQIATAGQRVRYARLVAGFHSRKLLSNKHGISHNTLQGWEQGKSRLTIKGAKRLVNALLQEGVSCSTAWLLRGEGEPPKPMLPPETIDPAIKEACDWQQYLAKEHQLIQREIHEFRAAFPNTVVTRVFSDALAPFYYADDLVGGVRLNSTDKIDKYLGKMCIVELHNSSVFTGLLTTIRFDIIVVSGPRADHKFQHTIKREKIKHVSPIIWHRRSLSHCLDFT